MPAAKRPDGPDPTGVALLGGIGFTASLLIGELAFDDGVPLGTMSRSPC